MINTTKVQIFSFILKIVKILKGEMNVEEER